jgi:hypothetical protein
MGLTHIVEMRNAYSTWMETPKGRDRLGDMGILIRQKY